MPYKIILLGNLVENVDLSVETHDGVVFLGPHQGLIHVKNEGLLHYRRKLLNLMYLERSFCTFADA